MRILITGSKGQLGSDLRDASSEFQNMVFDFTDIEELDLTNHGMVLEYFKEKRPDICINCAAYTAVDKAEDEEDLAMILNFNAVKSLAQACSDFNCKLIHISTDYIFDGTNHKPYNELDTPSPQSFYGYSKLKGEDAVLQIAEDTMIIRTSWLYSSYGHNFVKTMIRLASERKEISVVADQVGTPTYSADLAKTILEMINHFDINKLSGIYHYSNEGVISWFDFAKAIMLILNSNCKVNAIESKDFPAKAQRPFYSALNKTKIKTDFNIEIPYWQDSLKIAIQKILNQ